MVVVINMKNKIIMDISVFVYEFLIFFYFIIFLVMIRFNGNLLFGVVIGNLRRVLLLFEFVDILNIC